MSTIERLAIIVSVVVVAAGCIWYGISTRNTNIIRTPIASVSAQAPAAPKAQAGRVSSVVQVQVGEIGAVDAGIGMTDVATSPQALIGMALAGQKRNQRAYDDYFSRGLAFRVPDGTRAKLITGGEQVNQIQFVDGALTGKFGWIPAEWIRPTNAIPRKDRTD